MKDKARSLLAIEPGDGAVLRLLGATFAVAAASSIVIASVTKSLFLSAHPLERLPWVLLGSGLFTAGTAIAYVQAMQRFSVRRRFRALLGVAIASFIGLWALFPVDRQLMSLMLFVWAPGMGHLIIVQTWNLASTMLPTRQVKRLIPVLAGLATVGAAVGGAATRLLLELDFVRAEDLLLVAAALLCWPFFRVHRVVETLEENLPEVDEPVQDGKRRSEVSRGFRSILKTPLLARLAGFVFLMQAASVLIDYQFSGELKRNFEKDEMAAFLGAFYWASNVVVLVVSFFATSRIVKSLGIGIALSGVAVLLAVGSVVYLLAGLGGDVKWAFYVMAAIAFGERIGQYALTKNAVQMLVTPLDTRKAERAKTLIDGVIYRLATVLVSVGLLVAAPGFDQLHLMSPIVVVAGAVVLWIGLRIGPHYRRALLDGLRARRVDTATSDFRRLGLGRHVVDDVEQRIDGAQGPDDLRQALVVALELRVPVRASLLELLAMHDDASVATRALAKMAEQGTVPSKELMVSLLVAEKPAEVLRATLDRLAPTHPPPVLEAAMQLDTHPDIGVAALASALRQRLGGPEPTNEIEQSELELEIEADLMNSSPEIRARAIRITGGFDFTGLRGRVADRLAETGLPRMLEDPDLRVRLEAVEAMGQLQIPSFVDPLITALDSGELRPAAIEALSRFGEAALPVVSAQLRGGALSLMQRITLLNVVERMDEPPVALLMGQARSTDAAVRDHALLALWRLSRDRATKIRPPERWLGEGAEREIDLLRRFKEIELRVRGQGLRADFFRNELSASRVRAEKRAFLLLSLLYPRAPLHRAYLHYRSPIRRTRSNAVELLDQHLTERVFRPFVALVDRDSTATLPPMSMMPPEEGDAVTTLLGDDNPWLKRCWSWSGLSGQPPQADGDIDLVVLLRTVSMFSQMSGEPLLPVASIVKPIHFAPGQIVVREGDPGDRMFLVVQGEVEVLKNGHRVVLLGQRDAFGELAILDGAPRSATVRAVGAVGLLAIAGDEFDEQVDLHPALGRGIIRMLSRRLRQG